MQANPQATTAAVMIPGVTQVQPRRNPGAAQVQPGGGQSRVSFSPLPYPRPLDDQESMEQPSEVQGIEGRLYQASAAKALNARLVPMFALMLFMCWVTSWLTGPVAARNWFSSRLLLSLVLPKTMIATTWTFLGMMVVFFFRRLRLKAVREVEPNQLLRSARYFTVDFAALAAVHILSAYFIMNAYYDQSEVAVAKARYLYPEGRFGRPQLNPSYLYAQLNAVAVGLGHSLHYQTWEMDVVAFPPLTMAVAKALGSRLPTSLANGARFALRPALIFATFWLLFGHAVLYMIEIVFGGFWRMTIVRDPHAGFMAALPTFGVFIRCIVASSISCAMWNMLYDLSEVVYTESIMIADSDDNGQLIDGLKLKTKPFLRHHAFLELYRMSETLPRWRSDIFRDIRSTPTVWQLVCRQCLDVIQNLSSELMALSTPADEVTAVLQGRAVFREAQLVVWSARSLANLVVASLVDDPYGTVQRDVPDILECFITCLYSVEGYLRSPPSDRFTTSGGEVVNSAADMLGDSKNAAAGVPIPRGALAVMDVLHQSIYKIVIAFRDHLSEMKLDPVLSARLKPFIEMRAL